MHQLLRLERIAGFASVGHIVWIKNYAPSLGHTSYRHESAFVLVKGFPPKPLRPISDVLPWEYTGNRLHPTEKAPGVTRPLIEAFLRPGDLVLDPFAGSGSTVLAAVQSSRRAIGIELDESYAALAWQRLMENLGVGIVISCRWLDTRLTLKRLRPVMAFLAVQFVLPGINAVIRIDAAGFAFNQSGA